MAYTTVSHWTTTEWTDEMLALAQNTFVPMILAAGASAVQMVQTGELEFCVVTQYSDEATAKAAQSKIADIRAKAASDLPMSMSSACGGPVFASA